MAMVIAFAIVIAQECHRVIFRNMFWVLLHERLGAVPQCWDRLDVFVQAQDKAILLLIVFHKFEWVVMDIAEKLHAWLNTPVVLELVHEGMSEEEARLETTHMPVADGVAIYDLALGHVLAHFARFILVDEGRERPVLFRDFAIVCLSRDEGCCDLLEVVVKSVVIQKDPVVIVVPVESILNLTD